MKHAENGRDAIRTDSDRPRRSRVSAPLELQTESGGAPRTAAETAQELGYCPPAPGAANAACFGVIHLDG